MAAGPRRAFFDGLKEYSIVAEDLGIIDEGVRQLLAETGYPGMKVLSFAFDGNPDNPYLPSRFGENAAVYTGTHDNPPVKAWLMGQSREERFRLTAKLKRECRALSLPMRAETPDSLTDKLIEVALASRAVLAVIPYCDLLKLGEEGRINAPSHAVRPQLELSLLKKRLYGRAAKTPVVFGDALRERIRKSIYWISILQLKAQKEAAPHRSGARRLQR